MRAALCLASSGRRESIELLIVIGAVLGLAAGVLGLGRLLSKYRSGGAAPSATDTRPPSAPARSFLPTHWLGALPPVRAWWRLRLNRRIVDCAPLIVAVLDRPHGAYRFLSPYTVTLLGYSPDELLAMGSGVFGNVIDPDNEANWQAHFRSLDEGTDTLVAEILLKARRRDGSLRWLLCRDRCLRRSSDGSVREILTMAMDVSLLMETRRRIIESRNQAEAASRAKDEFMTLISHELHTPLNAVFGGVQLLQQETMNEHQQEAVEFIHEGGLALRHLFSDLLEYSQAQAESKVADEDIHIIDELEYLRVRGFEMAADRALDWRLEVEPDLPSIVQGDRNRLLSVLRHLVENAMKFTEKGEVCCAVAVRRRKPREVWLEINVRDTGVGFPADAKDRIFDPFQQAESTGTRRFSGSGIGLTIARRHVELMGGTIDVESESGKGTRFQLIIPFRLP